MHNHCDIPSVPGDPFVPDQKPELKETHPRSQKGGLPASRQVSTYPCHQQNLIFLRTVKTYFHILNAKYLSGLHSPSLHFPLSSRKSHGLFLVSYVFSISFFTRNVSTNCSFVIFRYSASCSKSSFGILQ